MGELILKLPRRFSDNFGEPINFFIDCISQLNTINHDSVLIDLRENFFTPPAIVGGLASIYESCLSNNLPVKVLLNPRLSNYLETIYFPVGFDYKGCSKEELSIRLSPFHNKTFIPLISFGTVHKEEENKIREQLLSVINSILKTQLGLPTSILQAIYYFIDEMSQNIIDHSDSPKGILCAQFYKSKNYLDVCIVDYGKGIYQSYKDTGKHSPTSNEDAINFAIFGKSTKDRAESRGFGISTSKKMLVKGLGGNFFIYSGNSFYHENVEADGLISMEDANYYKGCYIAMRIPIFNNQQFNFYNYTE